VNKCLPAVAVLALLAGCTTNPRGSVPVVEAGGPLSAGAQVGGYRPATNPVPATPVQEDSGVVVMVPPGSGTAPIQTFPTPTSSPSFETAPSSEPSQPYGGYSAPAPSTPSGIPGGGLAGDEQLDGPVLALLTTAKQQQDGGDLNGASSSLERAQRIAPREPQVLYRLAEVRLAQGDAAQAEQLARRGLTYAGNRPALQASLWELIAQARERQGDPAGADQARQRARVSL
jgi:hypothetical protein